MIKDRVKYDIDRQKAIVVRDKQDGL